MNIKMPSSRDIERINNRINEFQYAKDKWDKEQKQIKAENILKYTEIHISGLITLILLLAGAGAVLYLIHITPEQDINIKVIKIIFFFIFYFLLICVVHGVNCFLSLNQQREVKITNIIPRNKAILIKGFDINTKEKIWITSFIIKIRKFEISKAKSFNTGEIITIKTSKHDCRFS